MEMLARQRLWSQSEAAVSRAPSTKAGPTAIGPAAWGDVQQSRYPQAWQSFKTL